MAPQEDGHESVSDDSEDEDFCPVAEGGERQKRGRVSRPGRGTGRGSGGARARGRPWECEAEEAGDFEGSDGSGGDGEIVEEERKEVQEEQPTLPTPARAAKKAKIDGIWAALNGGGAGSPAVGGSTPLGAACRLESGDIGRGTTLASLCQPIKQTASVVDPDKHWMKGLGISNSDQDSKRELKPLDKQAALSALQAVKMAASMTAGRASGKVIVKEKANFAGKEIEVEKEVSAAEAQRQQAKRSGLDTLLASLKGDKKVSVLDKSRDDWRNFKKSNVEVEEELEMHKRSDAQYLDKQAFLKKAELRQYEIERDQRLASDVRTRGRL
eukprot:CAMPEP_0177772532 /NCGR_PEP_ID=MMETSP0491_2-20121128/12291_1 /TAXON_ID=63592 /ORGANISM="Tetraselmis chuii, Strain PLY429" /LENGTH=326 /DNA_ID=CAMNT_0019290385 /DNA_START=41 /DNA_END=1021 /DNA_ORIENTATION=+